jgi:hypothetical protein
MERSNHDTIERLTGVDVSTLPRLTRADPELLAAAGAGLPLAAWVD